jgi:dipeptidyl aminopeptidase/acylaminoacyl peptidase
MTKLITPDHIFDLTSVSEPSLSPDGSTLVFVKITVDRETMTRESRIMVSSQPFDEKSALTDGTSDSSPTISPDGAKVAFLRSDERGKKQICMSDLSGGEPRQVSDLPGGTSEPAWSPNGNSIAVVSSVDPDNRDDTWFPKTKVVRRIRYRHDHRGYTGDAFRQVFVIDTESRDARQITDGEGDNLSPTWSPDGKSIAFISDDLKDRDFTTNTQAKVVSLSSGETMSWSADLPYIWSVAWSPDGNALAAIGCHDPEMWDPRSAWLYVLKKGQPAQRITDGLYTPVPDCGLRWTNDSRIVFVGVHRGEYFLCTIRTDGADFKLITPGGVQFDGLTVNADATDAVLVVESPDSHTELAQVRLDTGSGRTLTSYNSKYFEGHPPVASVEKFAIIRGGFGIESRVLFPPDFNDSQKYPVVLDIHGGPNGRFSDNFDPVHQILATHGYIVLAVNPRGSSTYSPEFTKSVLGDWGGEDFSDILASVDELAKRPYIDEDRMAVHGFSYGGFMSGWIVGHDTRFKAAIVGAMCANLHSMYGTSDIGTSFGEINWGGVYTEARDKLLEHSPITYAPNVETPVLLLHGEADLRCPIEQSEQYFVALKRLGKIVEFVRFPDSPHGFRKAGHPKLIVEYYEYLLGWLERYVGVDPT